MISDFDAELIKASILAGTDEKLTQRYFASKTGMSLGSVNSSLAELVSAGYLTESYQPTSTAIQLLEEHRPRHAVILAAGVGTRMVPINMETPKALLTANGETLIERLVRQLHEVDVTDITVVVGFQKEKFEYLIDTCNVKLCVNTEYLDKNNLHSLNLYLKKQGTLNNTYIVPGDLYAFENPFSKVELNSWYLVSEKTSKESNVHLFKGGLSITHAGELGNRMIGISYLTGESAGMITSRLNAMDVLLEYDSAFWEESLVDVRKKRFLIAGKMIQDNLITEINTYEDLRNLDSSSNYLKSDALQIISEVFKVSESDITDITVLKKGMTNRSFLFSVQNARYIMRIPGEGTGHLINRAEEYAVYQVIKDKNICDDVYYMNPENGYKITRFLENSRCCNPTDENDLKACMVRLRHFHELNLQVEHTFDLFERLEFYESLWNGASSVYRDYAETKRHVYALKSFVEEHMDKRCLTHIDAVPDNFLFSGDEIRLIDWEYAGMQDPHVDIAMFAIYSLYEKQEQIDHLIDLYFTNADGVWDCPQETRIKIYCYVAICGLLWSNWCEYKRQLGVEFGEYSIMQYRYAKTYYRIAVDAMKEIQK